MNNTAIEIGQAKIELDYVNLSRSTKEEGSVWLNGTASVTWESERGGQTIREREEVEIGCWADCDDDHSEWNVSHEGQRIIERCLGMKSSHPETGLFVALAFRDECKTLGAAVCRMLREEATTE